MLPNACHFEGQFSRVSPNTLSKLRNAPIVTWGLSSEGAEGHTVCDVSQVSVQLRAAWQQHLQVGRNGTKGGVWQGAAANKKSMYILWSDAVGCAREGEGEEG